MSSSLTLILAISPTLIGLSFLLPFIYGWFGKSWYSALSLGWFLFILSSMLAPIYNRLIILESISQNSEITPPTQLSPWLAIGIGWILPLAGYLLGKKLSDWKKNTHN